MKPYPLDTVLARLDTPPMSSSRPAAGSRVIPCPISHVAGHGAETIAVQFDTAIDDGSWTYFELNRRVEQRITICRREGLLDGDVVALYGGAPEDVICWLFAGFRMGLRMLVVSPRIPEATLPDRLRDAGAICMVSPEPAPEGIRWIAANVDDHPKEQIDSDPDRSASPSVRGAEAISADRIATLLYTSGSTGSARIVAHTFSNHLFSAAGVLDRISLGPGDSWLLSLGLHHVGGLAILFRCFLSGASVRISRSRPGADAEGITHLSLVATQLRRILDRPAPWLRNVREIIVGGGPVSDHLLRRCSDARLPVRITYGSTEMASMVTLTDGATNTSGSVLRYREINLSDSSEVMVRGQTLFSGYWVGGGLERALDTDGWFRTRDLGALRDGDLVIQGRLDNQFISGGENIQPEEIEQQLLGISGVIEAVVVPIKSDEYGLRPVAFVRRDADAPLNEGINRSLRERLPGFKVPDAFYDWPDDEISGLKVSRCRLAELAERLSRDSAT